MEKKKSGHFQRMIDKFGANRANEERSLGAKLFKAKKKSKKVADASKKANRG